MKAIIKSLAGLNDNYNRFGKLIPTEEKEIDILKFFGIKADREESIINRLKSDKKIKFILIDEPKKIEVKKDETEEPKKRGPRARGE
jgi:hypothetical protein